MIRKRVKKDILELLNAIKQMHSEIYREGKMDKRVVFLEQCQQAAIEVGETLEKQLDDSVGIVHELESYCELLFVLSQKENITSDTWQQFEAAFAKIVVKITELPVCYQIVFMPYKAAMWDSLESIWLACRNDRNCECLVVPIPYFQYDARQKNMIPCYEGKEFPSYVPIVDYRNYKLETERPDAVYIHNPYDGHNYVTSVHPSYYSKELKKYADKLVYVPYYVTSGFLSEDDKWRSAYLHVDYIIAQSEIFKEGFRGLPYADKVKLFGSPKLDRVIRMNREDITMPGNWREVLSGKKVLMLNTSLGCFLQDGVVYLEKLASVFCEIRHYSDKLALIWRPHPLLKGTIQAMRPELLEQYEELVTFFKEEKIGIWDDTPDITKTVAIADAYIGEMSSSVINLFYAAGKPIFILHNGIREPFSDAQKVKLFIGDMIKYDGAWWLVAQNSNGLYRMDDMWDNIEFVSRVPNQTKWAESYPFMNIMDDKLFLSPMFANRPAFYDIKQDKMKVMNAYVREHDVNLRCRKVAVYGNKIFFLPLDNGMILEYDLLTDEWAKHIDCIIQLKEEIQEDFYEDIYDYAIYEHFLILTASYTNKVLRFDMETGLYKLLEIGNKNDGYSGIVYDGTDIWLAEVHSGRLVRYNLVSGEQMHYEMPDELSLQRKGQNRKIVHSALVDMGKWIVTVPGFTNGMVRVNKETGKTELLIEEFWADAERYVNGYMPHLYFASYFAKKLDEKTMCVQRRSDLAIAIINVDSGQYEVKYPAMTQESFRRFMEDQDGFEKIDTMREFSRKESSLFSLRQFFEELANGNLQQIKKRQLESVSAMAVNLDGSCGEKIHEYVMSVLMTEG